MPTITPCLWFDNQAEEAAEFYTSIFPNSRINAVTRYGPGAPQPELLFAVFIYGSGLFDREL